MSAPKLPRRRIVRRGQRRVVLVHGATCDARYALAVDVLACGHEVFTRANDPATTGCPGCLDGRPTGFHPEAFNLATRPGDTFEVEVGP